MLIHGDYTSSHSDKTCKPVMILTGGTPFYPGLALKENMTAKRLGKAPPLLKCWCMDFFMKPKHRIYYRIGVKKIKKGNP